MSSAPIYHNCINGEWIPADSGATYENRNPASRKEVVGIFAESASEDVDRAVAAASEALQEWRLYPAPRRAEILFRAGRMLIDRKDELARQMTREMGKILIEAGGDVQEAIDMTHYIAGEGRRQSGQTAPSELMNKFAMSVREPLGVCGLITPWNFPMAIPSWKIMPALICGNTAVIKPATDTPLSALNLVRILHEAGLPKGVLNLITGSGSAVGTPLLRHKSVKVISFTGSTEVGRMVAQECAPDFKRHHLEMGGKNVIIVMADANIDLAVEGAIWGGFGTTGQRCTAASRIVVHEKVYHDFLEKFAARAKTLRVGDGLDPAVEMGPLINESQRQTVEEYVDIGCGEGARLVCGGHRLSGSQYAEGYFFEPTIFADVSPQMRIAQEEIFGPVVSVLHCKDLDEAIEIGNGVVYGLSASIYTQDVNMAFKAMRDMDTGIFYVNATTIGAEVHLPFGGTKHTGNGHREAGQAALDFFSEWKAVYIDFSGRLQRAQLDT